MSAAPAYQQPRFVRRTRLHQNEYNRNFKMVDEETLAALTSPEADRVTPMMSKIYLRLLQVPASCCRGERELHFEGEVREGKRIKAWDQLCQHLRVSSETAQKALGWMHQQGIIGYSAFKNRVGIFIFLNRAASSIGERPAASGEKILHFSPASPTRRPASVSDTASNDPFGVLENLDTDFNPHAQKNCADSSSNNRRSFNPASAPATQQRDSAAPCESGAGEAALGVTAAVSSHHPLHRLPTLDEIVNQLQSVVEPALRMVAVETSRREHERTRAWLDRHGIPKATRVAQREAYNVLRSHGVMAAAESRRRADGQVGRAVDSQTSREARPLAKGEIAEIAESCLALLEAQGKPLESTLAEISAEAGGWLLAEDVARVGEAARTLIQERNRRG